jgi:hypothetical protein
VIRCVALFAALAFAGFPVKAVDVPSGQPVELWEVLVDRVGEQTWLRFRFLTPEIAKSTGTVSFDTVEGDFEVLCTQVALPYIAEHALPADVVVISMLDRAVEFGQSDAEATQYIDAFRPDGATCVWEAL